ncbi:MAG: type III pantothenate kinase [Deltaproteobacteria bacterium]|nr:MAG: type III pantothenate kinase [Deltaproteobacteria bacterium]
MLLAVDVGNTNTTLGVFTGDRLDAELRLSTRRDWTRDEVAIGFERALALAGRPLEDVRVAVVACVVPPVLPAVVEALERYAGVSPLVVGPGIRTGMQIRYDPPQDVGADRVVTAVAAWHRYGGDGKGVVIVDCGTATTFDVVSPVPEYLGGVIAPGIGIGADALFARAAKLPRIDLSLPARAVGRNTADAMRSGVVLGHVAMVDGMLARIRDEVDFPFVTVATGGFGRVLAGRLPAVDHHDDTLVLEGLRRIAERNAD